MTSTHNTHAETVIEQAVDAAIASLATAGDWLAGNQRLAAWAEVRDARTNPLDAERAAALSPYAGPGRHSATDLLSAEAVDVLHRVSSDPGRLRHEWAEAMIGSLGEETYVELVGIAATASVLDMFFWALHSEEAPLPLTATAGDPAQHRPDDVGEVGAWVAQSVAVGLANVSRSLSLVPETNKPWIGLVQAMYSRGAEFAQLEWKRALSRPQVELVASRTTAENECFY